MPIPDRRLPRCFGPNHRARLQAALLDTFDRSELRSLLADYPELDTDLDHIAPHQADLTTVCAAVVAHFAGRRGGVERLLAAARAERAQDPALAALAAEWEGQPWLPPALCPRRPLRWLAAGGALLAVVLIVAYFWYWQPMPGGFGVAVAPFTAQDGDGRPIRTSVGRQLASGLAKALGRPDLRYNVRPPGRIWPLSAATPAAASALAGRLRATFVIYGRLVQRRGSVELTPTFYLADHAAGAPLAELAGDWSFGVRLTEAGDLSTASVYQDMEDGLETHAESMAFFLKGLEYYGRRDYAEARRYFALAEPGWGPEAMHVLHFFSGHAAAALGDDAEARHRFEAALAANPQARRAQVALANMDWRAIEERGCSAADASELHTIRAQMADVVAEAGSAPSHLRLEAALTGGHAAICLLASQPIPREWATKPLEQAQADATALRHDLSAAEARFYLAVAQVVDGRATSETSAAAIAEMKAAAEEQPRALAAARYLLYAGQQQLRLCDPAAEETLAQARARYADEAKAPGGGRPGDSPDLVVQAQQGICFADTLRGGEKDALKSCSDVEEAVWKPYRNGRATAVATCTSQAAAP